MGFLELWICGFVDLCNYKLIKVDFFVEKNICECIFDGCMLWIKITLLFMKLPCCESSGSYSVDWTNFILKQPTIHENLGLTGKNFCLNFEIWKFLFQTIWPEIIWESFIFSEASKGLRQEKASFTDDFAQNCQYDTFTDGHSVTLCLASVKAGKTLGKVKEAFRTSFHHFVTLSISSANAPSVVV